MYMYYIKPLILRTIKIQYIINLFYTHLLKIHARKLRFFLAIVKCLIPQKKNGHEKKYG